MLLLDMNSMFDVWRMILLMHAKLMCKHDCLNYMKYNCVRIIRIEYINWHHCIHEHSYIALSRVWVHGMVVHHSW